MSQAKAPETLDTRYDRQKRLWGATGQKALGSATVCLLGASPAGCEALKNLVLAGVGNFVIVDGNTINYDDVGANFFAPVESIGKSRAQVIAETIGELNPYVKGKFVNDTPKDFLEKNAAACNEYTVVISGGLPMTTVIPLSEQLFSRDVPLVHLKCNGLFGYIRVQLNRRCIIETFPDWYKIDLRLDKPFPALQELFEEFGDPSKIDKVAASDQYDTVPWPVLVYYLVKEWRAENNKSAAEFPAFADRKKLGTLLSKRANPKSNNYFEGAENIKNNAITPPLSPNLSEYFRRSEADEPKTEFWALLRAVRDFHDANGVLPHSGKIPDMHANSASYLKLKKCYQTKGSQDAADIQARAKALLPSGDIPLEMATAMCINAPYIRVIEGTSIASEMQDEVPAGLSPWYTCMRASETVLNSSGKYPGELDGADIETDVAALARQAGATCPLDIVREYARFGNTQLSTVATVMGGIATQEIQKILTHQRVPINTSLIFDGVKNETITFHA